MKHYTDIDPTVDFVFPVNKIDREKGEKTNLKLTKCVFRSCNLRTKYVFTSKDHCNVHHFFYRSIASVVASCNTNNFFSVPRFSIRRKKNPQKLDVFFLDQNRKNYRLYGIYSTLWWAVFLLSLGIIPFPKIFLTVLFDTLKDK